MEKLIVFDFDGTLVDSASQFKEIIKMYYKNNLPNEVCSEEVANNIVKHYGEYGNFDYKITLNNKQLSKEEQGKVVFDIMEYMGQLRKNNKVSFRFFNGAKEFLHSLKDSYDLVICSGSAKESIEYSLQENNLSPLFKNVVSERSEHINKPNPELLKRAIDSTKNNYKQIIVVGDTDNDIQLANNFKKFYTNYNVKTIAVSYGFFQDKQHLQQFNPDKTVDSLEELKDNLNNLQEVDKLFNKEAEITK